MIQSGGAADRQAAPPAGSPRSWSSTTVMLDLIEEFAQGSHRCFGILEVHVVTGTGDRHVTRAQPSDALRLLLRREIAPGVVLGPGDHEHRALHAALLLAKELDVEFGRHAEPEHRIGFPHISAAGTLAASVSREMLGP